MKSSMILWAALISFAPFALAEEKSPWDQTFPENNGFNISAGPFVPEFIGGLVATSLSLSRPTNIYGQAYYPELEAIVRREMHSNQMGYAALLDASDSAAARARSLRNDVAALKDRLSAHPHVEIEKTELYLDELTPSTAKKLATDLAEAEKRLIQAESAAKLAFENAAKARTYLESQTQLLAARLKTKPIDTRLLTEEERIAAGLPEDALEVGKKFRLNLAIKKFGAIAGVVAMVDGVSRLGVAVTGHKPGFAPMVGLTTYAAKIIPQGQPAPMNQDLESSVISAGLPAASHTPDSTSGI